MHLFVYFIGLTMIQFIRPDATGYLTKEPAQHVCKIAIIGDTQGHIPVCQLPGIYPGLFQAIPVILKDPFDKKWILPYVAGTLALHHPKDAIRRVKFVSFNIVDVVLCNYIYGKALARIVNHTFSDAQLTGFKQPGIIASPSQVGLNQRTHIHVPVGN